ESPPIDGARHGGHAAEYPGVTQANVEAHQPTQGGAEHGDLLGCAGSRIAGLDEWLDAVDDEVGIFVGAAAHRDAVEDILDVGVFVESRRGVVDTDDD